MAQFLNRHEALSIDLRLGHVRRQQARWHGPSIGGTAPVVSRPGPGSQPAIVKVWGASPGTTGRHLRYLTRGKGTDGTDTTLFNAQGYVLNTYPFTHAAQHDPHQFRMVVSVLDNGQLNLVRFIQTFMRQVARDLKQPLDYVAAVHRDTAYTHTHLVIRGRDLQGHTLSLPRQYLHYGLRYRVMHLATAWLGKVPHLERGVQQRQAKQVSTAMDAQVKEAKKEDTMDDDVSLDRFRDLVDRHDLTFGYSDDPEVRQRGREELQVIHALRAALGPEHHEASRDIWNANIDAKMHPVERHLWHWTDRPSAKINLGVEAPRSSDQTTTESRPTLVQRLQALIEARQQAREKVQAKDRGMGL